MIKSVLLSAVAHEALAVPELNNPCLDSTSKFASLPWCDYTLPLDERVADMVSRMPLAEKIPQLCTSAPAIPSLGLEAYNWWSEASTGISNGKAETTKFPF